MARFSPQDGGATWSAPVKINNQASLNDQFNQWLAVDETTGLIGIMYYDTVGDSGRKKTDVWYQSSPDDGASWSAAQKVTTAMTDETISGADSGNQYGDYNGLTGYANMFFPSWTDRRNLAREEIWTSKITETPAATANISATGSTTVAGACNNPPEITPQGTVTVSFCVQNTGTLATTNLVGTLQATGGVLNPSGPQSYGVVSPGGGAVCRDFNFTADAACGGTITAAIQFQDGANNLGTITYNLPVVCAPTALSASVNHATSSASMVDLPLTACWNHCRTGGAGGDHQVIITFANPVTVTGASVASGGGSVGTYSVSGPEVTVNLTGVANAQTVTISLDDVSDGTNMGCVAIPMSVLLGDTNANGAVNATDVAQTKSRIGQTLDVTNFRSDVNLSFMVSNATGCCTQSTELPALLALP